MTRPDAELLLETWIDNPALRHHCRMVSAAMLAYADKLGKDAVTRHQWGLAGLLHELDWEKHPDEHPTYALTRILPGRGLWDDVLDAIKAHAPERTGKHPETEIERYLFACDELIGSELDAHILFLADVFKP